MGAPRGTGPLTDAARRPWARVLRAGSRATAVVDAQRRRRPWFDHLARATGRYQRSQGELLAAGVTYYVFLGLFPVLLLVAAVIGLVLAGNEVLEAELYAAIREAFPGPTGRFVLDELRGAVGSAGVVGAIGLVGFVYAGLRAMDKLRIGMEQMWKGRADEPEFWRDNLADLVALLALGAVGVLSLGLTGTVTRAATWLVDVLGLDDAPGVVVVTTVLGLGLALVTDLVVFLWLLRVVPSTSHPLRRLLPGAVFGAVGFELMKLAGSLYLSLIDGSVTSSAFGGAVGILVWLNVVVRFAFFTAAWTATLPSLTPVVPADPAPPARVPAASGAPPAAGG
jgi:membrane protein